MSLLPHSIITNSNNFSDIQYNNSIIQDYYSIKRIKFDRLSSTDSNYPNFLLSRSIRERKKKRKKEKARFPSQEKRTTNRMANIGRKTNNAIGAPTNCAIHEEAAYCLYVHRFGVQRPREEQPSAFTIQRRFSFT